MIQRERVAVTGMGAVSSLGDGCDALWRGLAEGRDGIRPLARFSTEGFTVHLGALVPGHDRPDADEILCVSFARSAALEALRDARVAVAGIAAGRIALVVGTSLGRVGCRLHRYAELLADELGIAGPRLTISTACTSSAIAIGLALDLLRADVAEIVVAGGTDELTPEIFAGFHALGVLSADKCAPFSSPPGTTLGEGAGFLVLETEMHARARGVDVRAVVSGYGIAADAYHETSPDPSGAGVARAICAALADAGLEPAQVGAYNAHGTGTIANDPAEWRALVQVFGERAQRLPVSAPKSSLGHAQGAAGVLEAIATILALEHGAVLPTLHFRGPRRDAPPDPVSDGVPRLAPVEHVVSGSSAFGGSNAALVLSARDARTTPALSGGRRIWVAGLGAVGAHGLDLDALDAALAAGAPLSGRVPAFSIEGLVRQADPRGLDPSSRFLTAAAALALADAGIRLTGARRNRTGLVTGVTALSAASARAFRDSIVERGLPGLSATAFARMVLNAPAGTCSACHSIRGPLSTITTGEGSGLVALIQAACLLETRGELDLLLAAGLDELAPEDAPGQGEGAACLLLAASRPERHGSPRLAGWGLAGPSRLELALEAALRRAAIPFEALDVCFGADAPGDLLAARGSRARALPWCNPATVIGRAEAAGAVFACAAAVLALRKGRCRAALVTSGGGHSASAAVILLAEENDGC